MMLITVLLPAAMILDYILKCYGSNPYTFTVTENCAIGTIVADMRTYRRISNLRNIPKGRNAARNSVTANGSSAPSKKIYSLEIIGLENGNHQKLFIINPVTGQIKVNSNIDREEICPALSGTTGTCRIILLVTIFNDIVNVEGIIVDENDNAPKFSTNSYTFSIKESTPVGMKLFLEHATDLDSAANGIGKYELTSQRDNIPFVLHYNISVVYVDLIEQLDFEKVQSYQLTLSVCDTGKNILCSSRSININILDINDNYPVFQRSKYFAIISEDLPIGEIVLQVVAVDKDSPKYGLVRYRFSNVNNDASRWFRLDDISGKIILIQPLTMQIRNYKFIVEAYDNGNIPRINRTVVTIHIKDINNNAPNIKITKSTFQTNIYNRGPNKSVVTFYENNPRNTDIVFFVVTDEDSDENGEVNCKMISSTVNAKKQFELQKFNSNNNKLIYRLVALTSLDCEQMSKYALIINCSDKGAHPRYSTHILDIRILDINEYPAKFNQTFYSGTVRENSASFNLLMPISDKDCTSDFSVIISNQYARDHFRYLRLTEQLSLYKPLDYETSNNINFSVKLINKGSREDSQTFESQVEITVSDENDNPPYLVPPVKFIIKENDPIGTIVGRLRANDSDSNRNSQFQFSKENSSSNHFLIGSNGEIRLAKELDRETMSIHHISVIVSDMGIPSLSSIEKISIEVLDVNDNSPQWIFPNRNDNILNESIHKPIGIVLTRLHASDIDSKGNNNVTYHLVNSENYPFQLNSINGELSYSSLPEQGKYVLDVVAVDNGRPIRSNRTKLIVYISDKTLYDQTNSGLMGSRSYFTIVAIVPVLILICLLILILCLLVIVKRRNVRAKNRRSRVKENQPQKSSEKNAGRLTPNDKLLKSKLMEMQPPADVTVPSNVENLDLTETSVGPKVSYQCIVATNTGGDMDVCSADSGQGASEDDVSNCMMLKQHQSDPFRFSLSGGGGPSSAGAAATAAATLHFPVSQPHPNQHCCPTLPENSIAHFICSTLNAAAVAAASQQQQQHGPSNMGIYSSNNNINNNSHQYHQHHPLLIQPSPTVHHHHHPQQYQHHQQQQQQTLESVAPPSPSSNMTMAPSSISHPNSLTTEPEMTIVASNCDTYPFLPTGQLHQQGSCNNNNNNNNNNKNNNSFLYHHHPPSITTSAIAEDIDSATSTTPFHIYQSHPTTLLSKINFQNHICKK